MRPCLQTNAQPKNAVGAGWLDRVFGLHVWNFMDAGTIGIREGPITANSDRIYIDITGAGGHGSMPQGTVEDSLLHMEAACPHSSVHLHVMHSELMQ